MNEPLDELVEHVDGDGNVLDIVTRAAIRAGALRHRCTYIAVLRSSGRVVVHRRADWKSIYPGWWDICFGGICGVGEAWGRAAARELAEEAGLSGEALHELGEVHYDADDGRVLGRAFAVVTDETVVAVDGEVAELDEVAIEDLTAWMTSRPVCRDSAEAVLPLLLAPGVAERLLRGL